jgi:hypothetical protein
MMSNWLKVIEVGVKVACSGMLVAESSAVSHSVTCILGGSLSLVPVAWAMARQIVADDSLHLSLKDVP